VQHPPPVPSRARHSPPPTRQPVRATVTACQAATPQTPLHRCDDVSFPFLQNGQLDFSAVLLARLWPQRPYGTDPPATPPNVLVPGCPLPRFLYPPGLPRPVVPLVAAPHWSRFRATFFSITDPSPSTPYQGEGTPIARLPSFCVGSVTCLAPTLLTAAALRSHAAWLPPVALAAASTRRNDHYLLCGARAPPPPPRIPQPLSAKNGRPSCGINKRGVQSSGICIKIHHLYKRNKNVNQFKK